MSFRTKVLLTVGLSVALSVWLVAAAITIVLTRHFEEQEQQRAVRVQTSFQRELARNLAALRELLARAAGSDAVSQLAAEVGSGVVDPAAHLNLASETARALGIPFFEIVGPDRRIISSAHWSARFGYEEPNVLNVSGDEAESFFGYVETESGQNLAALAVGSVPAGESRIYLVAGVPAEELVRKSAEGLGESELVELRNSRNPLSGVVEQARQTRNPVTRSEKSRFHGLTVEQLITAIPLLSRSREVVGAVLLEQQKTDLALLKSYIREIAIGLGALGSLAGMLVGWIIASRVTWPVNELSAAVEELGRGNWNVTAPVHSKDEIGRLAEAFNRMTRELVESRERLLQSERVAAWRELARRLAHELKNPLFPLQITIENLQRARAASLPPAEFDEVFEESTRTLLSELTNLKHIVGQFSNFAKMPPPQLEPTDINSVVREELPLLRGLIAERKDASIELETALSEGLPSISADPEQLRRVIRNLVLNAIDAMPEGGRLRLATSERERLVRLEVSDTGVGLTPEEAERLFTPYYTTKQHGTGLGLAIVQSVVSDHQASIAVASSPGKGTTFTIDFRNRAA